MQTGEELNKSKAAIAECIRNEGITSIKANLESLTNRLVTGLLFVLLTVQTLSFHSQEHHRIVLPDPIPAAYLGLGAGINNYSGLIGIGLEMPIFPPFTIFGQAGIGTWGTKVGGGLRYYQHPDLYGSAWALGYSRASGLTDFEVELEIENPKMNTNVLLDLEKVGTLNFDYSYNLKIGRKSKISFHVGYAFALNNGDNYVLKTSGVQLSSTSKQTLKIMQPGGLLLGLALMFGM
jgi:hypothetical protein